MSTENGLTLEEQATNAATSQHIRTVQKVIHLFVKSLLDRADNHDQSKLAHPEVELFTKYTPLLHGVTYNSEEYNEFRRLMAPALEHHYARNDHHPEHFKARPENYQLKNDIEAVEACSDMSEAVKNRVVKNLKSQLKVYASSINEMNLIQLVEMFCDWKAATLRHNDGNIRKSIEDNAERFGMSKQMCAVLENTAGLLDDVKG